MAEPHITGEHVEPTPVGEYLNVPEDIATIVLPNVSPLRSNFVQETNKPDYSHLFETYRIVESGTFASDSTDGQMRISNIFSAGACGDRKTVLKAWRAFRFDRAVLRLTVLGHSHAAGLLGITHSYDSTPPVQTTVESKDSYWISACEGGCVEFEVPYTNQKSYFNTKSVTGSSDDDRKEFDQCMGAICWHYAEKLTPPEGISVSLGFKVEAKVIGLKVIDKLLECSEFFPPQPVTFTQEDFVDHGWLEPWHSSTLEVDDDEVSSQYYKIRHFMSTNAFTKGGVRSINDVRISSHANDAFRDGTFEHLNKQEMFSQKFSIAVNESAGKAWTMPIVPGLKGLRLGSKGTGGTPETPTWGFPCLMRHLTTWWSGDIEVTLRVSKPTTTKFMMSIHKVPQKVGAAIDKDEITQYPGEKFEIGEQTVHKFVVSSGGDNFMRHCSSLSSGAGEAIPYDDDVQAGTLVFVLQAPLLYSSVNKGAINVHVFTRNVTYGPNPSRYYRPRITQFMTTTLNAGEEQGQDYPPETIVIGDACSESDVLDYYDMAMVTDMHQFYQRANLMQFEWNTKEYAKNNNIYWMPGPIPVHPFAPIKSVYYRAGDPLPFFYRLFQFWTGSMTYSVIANVDNVELKISPATMSWSRSSLASAYHRYVGALDPLQNISKAESYHQVTVHPEPRFFFMLTEFDQTWKVASQDHFSSYLWLNAYSFKDLKRATATEVYFTPEHDFMLGGLCEIEFKHVFDNIPQWGTVVKDHYLAFNTTKTSTTGWDRLGYVKQGTGDEGEVQMESLVDHSTVFPLSDLMEEVEQLIEEENSDLTTISPIVALTSTTTTTIAPRTNSTAEHVQTNQIRVDPPQRIYIQFESLNDADKRRAIEYETAIRRSIGYDRDRLTYYYDSPREKELYPGLNYADYLLRRFPSYIERGSRTRRSIDGYNFTADGQVDDIRGFRFEVMTNWDQIRAMNARPFSYRRNYLGAYSYMEPIRDSFSDIPRFFNSFLKSSAMTSDVLRNFVLQNSQLNEHISTTTAAVSQTGEGVRESLAGIRDDIHRITEAFEQASGRSTDAVTNIAEVVTSVDVGSCNQILESIARLMAGDFDLSLGDKVVIGMSEIIQVMQSPSMINVGHFVTRLCCHMGLGSSLVKMIMKCMERPVLEASYNGDFLSSILSVFVIVIGYKSSGGDQFDEKRVHTIWEKVSLRCRDITSIKRGLEDVTTVYKNVRTMVIETLSETFGDMLDFNSTIETQYAQRIQHVYEVLHEVAPTLDSLGRVGLSNESKNKLRDLYDDIFWLRQQRQKVRDVHLTHAMAQVSHLYDEISSEIRINSLDQPMRRDPYVFCLTGVPKLGKGDIALSLCRLLNVSQGFPSDDIFAYSSASKYQDNWNYNNLIFIDDIDQDPNDIDAANFFIRLKSNVPMAMTMAEVTKKGRQCNATCVVATSNLLYPRPPLYSINAYQRRRDVNAEILRHTNGMSDDYSHVVFRRQQCLEDDEKLNKESRSMNATQFFADAVYEYAQHLATQTRLVRRQFRESKFPTVRVYTREQANALAEQFMAQLNNNIIVNDILTSVDDQMMDQMIGQFNFEAFDDQVPGPSHVLEVVEDIDYMQAVFDTYDLSLPSTPILYELMTFSPQEIMDRVFPPHIESVKLFFKDFYCLYQAHLQQLSHDSSIRCPCRLSIVICALRELAFANGIMRVHLIWQQFFKTHMCNDSSDDNICQFSAVELDLLVQPLAYPCRQYFIKQLRERQEEAFVDTQDPSIRLPDPRDYTSDLQGLVSDVRFFSIHITGDRTMSGPPLIIRAYLQEGRNSQWFTIQGTEELYGYLAKLYIINLRAMQEVCPSKLEKDKLMSVVNELMHASLAVETNLDMLVQLCTLMHSEHLMCYGWSAINRWTNFAPLFRLMDNIGEKTGLWTPLAINFMHPATSGEQICDEFGYFLRTIRGWEDAMVEELTAPLYVYHVIVRTIIASIQLCETTFLWMWSKGFNLGYGIVNYMATKIFNFFLGDPYLALGLTTIACIGVLFYYKRSQKVEKSTDVKFLERNNTQFETSTDVNGSEKILLPLLDFKHVGMPDDGLKHLHLHQCVKCHMPYAHKHKYYPPYVAQNFGNHCFVCRQKNPDFIQIDEIVDIEEQDDVFDGEIPYKVTYSRGDDSLDDIIKLDESERYNPLPVPEPTVVTDLTLSEPIPVDVTSKTITPGFKVKIQLDALDDIPETKNREPEVWEAHAKYVADNCKKRRRGFEAGFDQQTSDFVTNTVVRCTGVLVVGSSTVNILGIKSNIIMTTAHLLAANFRGNHAIPSVLYLHGHKPKSFLLDLKKDVYRFPDIFDENIKKTVHRDLIFIVLRDKSIPPFPNLYEKFVDAKYIDMIRGSAAYMCYNDTPVRGTLQNCKLVLPMVTVMEGMSDEMGGLYFGSMYTVAYDAVTRPGLCGSPVILMNPHIPKGRICGIHMGSLAGCTRAWAHMVWRSLLVEHLAKAEVHFGEISASAPTAANIVTQLNCFFNEKPILYPDKDNYQIVGQIEPQFSPETTNIIMSPIFDQYQVHVSEPAILHKKDPRNLSGVHPSVAGANKYVSNEGMPQKCMKIVADWYIKKCYALSKEYPGPMRELSWDEVVNGVPGLIAPMNMDTSPGYPYDMMPERYGGKKFLFDAVTEENGAVKYVIKDFLQHDLDTAMRILEEEGYAYNCFYKFMNKDERRLRVKLSKTRGIEVVNIVWQMIQKKFYGALQGFLQWAKIHANSAIGSNMFGRDASSIANFIREVERHFALDISGYDEGISVSELYYFSYINGHLIRYCLISARKPLEGQRFLRMSILVVGASVIVRVHIWSGVVYIVYGGIPSGMYMTSSGDTIIWIIRIGCAWMMIVVVKNPTYKIHDIDKYTRNVFFGDDAINGVCEKLKDVWNAVTISEFLLSYNIKATMPTKDGTSIVPYQDWEDIVFLKCHFVEDSRFPGCWHAQMNKLSPIGELTNWIRDSLPVKDALLSNIHDAMRFMYAYGPEEFEKFQVDLIEILEPLNYPLPNVSYESCDYDWLSDHGLSEFG